jgi:hypothetical protein
LIGIEAIEQSCEIIRRLPIATEIGFRFEALIVRGDAGAFRRRE